MDITHGEADNITLQQMLMVAKKEPSGITVLSDDTDVSLLLLNYIKNALKILVTMRSPIKDRFVVDIGLIVDKHKVIIPEILLAHVLSGSITVA